jgi:DNA polymerase-3 subunit beta
MQLTVPKAPFLAALQRCAPAAEQHRPHATAGMVLLTAAEGKLVVSATNLQLLIEDKLGATIKKAGDVVVSCRRLTALVSVMGDTLTLSVDKDHKLKLSSGGQRKAQIAGLAAADYPQLSRPDGLTVVELPAGSLRAVIEQVEHAAGDTDRAFLDGVLVESAGGGIDAVALCSSRVAHTRLAVACPEGSWFIPRYAIKPLLGICGSGDDASVSFAVSEQRHLFLQSGSVSIAAVLPAESFPPWRKMLDTMQREPVARVSGLFLGNAVRAVLAAASQSDETVELKFDAEAKSLGVAVHDLASGNHAEDSIPCAPLDQSRSCTTRVQGRYLQSALTAANGEVTLEVASVADGAPPALFLSTDEGYLSLIMPLAK